MFRKPQTILFSNFFLKGTPFVGADGRIQSCAVSTSMNTCPNNYWCHVGANTASTVCCPDGKEIKIVKS